MGKLLQWIRQRFGAGEALPVDHLVGAVDLSDVPYCMSLLSREEE